MAELSYVKIKTANDARTADEERAQLLKRNILVLIRDHLLCQGYPQAAAAMEAECGANITRFEACDNVDLHTIVQEYESYFMIRFNKPPKVRHMIRSHNTRHRHACPLDPGSLNI